MNSFLNKIIGDEALYKITFILSALSKNLSIILLITIIAGVIGFFKTSSVKPTYTATYSFVLSVDQKTGGLSGLASQLGLDASTPGSDNIFSSDNIIDLFKSRTLVGKSLMAIADTPSHKNLFAIIASRKYPEDFNSLGPFATDPIKFNSKQTTFYHKVISDVDSSFNVYKKDRKLTFFIINATDTDPHIAYLTAKHVLNQTSQYFIATKTRVSSNSVKLLRHEADSLSGILKNAFNSSANLVDQTYNINPSATSQRAKIQYNQAIVNAVSLAYTEVLRNLEVAKLNLQKETPLYRIIDEPELPLIAIRPNILKKTIIYSFLGFLLATSLFAAYTYFINFYNSPSKKPYHE